MLDHSAEGDEYEVSAGIDGDQCVLEVVDRGDGFDGSLHGLAEADSTAEEGRGSHLMRALVDTVIFTSPPHEGTVVHLEKKLGWQGGSVIQHWTESRTPTEHGPWSREDRMDDAPGRA